MNWRNDPIGDAPFAAAVAGRFLFEKRIHGPFDPIKKIFGEKQTQFVGVGNFVGFVETTWSELMRRRRRAFVVQNVTDTYFILGKKCRIQRDLVPIGESVSSLEAKCRILKVTVKSFNIRFYGDVDPVR